MISVARDGGGADHRRDSAGSAQARLVDDARADPLVAAVLQTFPGAEIVDVRVLGDAPARRPTTHCRRFPTKPPMRMTDRWRLAT